MKRLSITLLMAVLATMAMVGCKSLPQQDKTREVPFTEAKHYFLRNDVKKLPQGKITSEEQLLSLFGMAPVMGGKDALPTEIDFDKQFAITATVPETDVDTEIVPLSLRQENGNLMLAYQVKRGEKRSYTIQPMLLIVVDKKYDAPLQLQEK